MRHSIFIVDDHPVVRFGIRLLCERATDLVVTGEAGSAADALEAIRRTPPNLALVDINLDGVSGLELIRQIKEQVPETKTLIVSMHDEMLYAEQVLQAGACGYVMKVAADTVLLDAVRLVLQGGIYVSEQVRERLLESNVWPGHNSVSFPFERLSGRELEAFQHIGRGLTTQQVAEIMGISPRTVSTYRERIKEKLGLKSSAELIQRAVLQAEQGRQEA